MYKKIDNVPPLLFCSKLIKYYQYSRFLVKVLNCITITIQYNEIIAIIGKSGSGKSTLLHLMGGLDKPTKGDVFFEGCALNKLSNRDCAVVRNKRMGFVYQFHHLLPDFSVLENIAMPLLIGGIKWSESKNKALSMLNVIGLEHKGNYYPYELSGGESQRVAIARSIINNPALVLADEPTGNLDEINSGHIFQLFRKINVLYNTTFVVATHNLNLAKKCHKIFNISKGYIENYTEL